MARSHHRRFLGSSLGTLRNSAASRIGRSTRNHALRPILPLRIPTRTCGLADHHGGHGCPARNEGHHNSAHRGWSGRSAEHWPNAFLIYGINLGIVGSGIGTSIVSTIMAISLVIILARPAHTLGVSLRPSLTGIRQSARVGGPLLARSVAIRLAFLTSIWSATAISVNGLAAYQVVMSAWQIPLFLLDSLAIASQTLVGFAIGSGDRSQLRTLLRTLSWWGIFAGIIIGALTAALSPWIPSFFVSEAVVRNMAIPALIVNAVFFPAQSHAFLLDGVLIGAGRGASLAKAAFLNLAILLPALWLFSVARPALTETQAVAVLIGLVTGLYMLTRALTNSWITWFSPKHALIPRHEAGAQSAE